MKLITAPGLYRDIEADEYFADPCPAPSLTQSLVKILIEQSPLHAKQQLRRITPSDGEEETVEKYDKARAIGNAAHAIMLSRGKTIAVIDHPNFTTKAAKEARTNAIADGAEPVLRKHADVAASMVLAATGQLSRIAGCENAFRVGNAEVVVAGCEDGLWLRSMIDWITPDGREVWDYKTSGQSASPFATGRLMASAGWHIQAAMHERILDGLDPANAGRRRYRYVCQENEPPFALTVNEIGEAALTIGRKQVQYAIDVWRECMSSGRWPAYPLRIIQPELPAWMMNGWIEREAAEHDARVHGRAAFDPRNLMAG